MRAFQHFLAVFPWICQFPPKGSYGYFSSHSDNLGSTNPVNLYFPRQLFQPYLMIKSLAAQEAKGLQNLFAVDFSALALLWHLACKGLFEENRPNNERGMYVDRTTGPPPHLHLCGDGTADRRARRGQHLPHVHGHPA